MDVNSRLKDLLDQMVSDGHEDAWAEEVSSLLQTLIDDRIHSSLSLCARCGSSNQADSSAVSSADASSGSDGQLRVLLKGSRRHLESALKEKAELVTKLKVLQHECDQWKHKYSQMSKREKGKKKSGDSPSESESKYADRERKLIQSHQAAHKQWVSSMVELREERDSLLEQLRIEKKRASKFQQVLESLHKDTDRELCSSSSSSPFVFERSDVFPRSMSSRSHASVSPPQPHHSHSHPPNMAEEVARAYEKHRNGVRTYIAEALRKVNMTFETGKSGRSDSIISDPHSPPHSLSQEREYKGDGMGCRVVLRAGTPSISSYRQQLANEFA